MANAIIDTFDLWSTAQNLKTSNRGLSASNQSLLGIKKLRELILELALQGKLTQSFREHNPELISGPNSAKTLIEKISTERLKNFKEGKIKKPEFTPEVGENEKPFELPEEWEWVRLQQIIQISSGDGLIASNMDSNGTVPVFGGNGINGYHNKGNITKPTLVIGRVGFYCGSIHITPKFAWVTDNAFITTFSEYNIDIHFLYWLLKGTNLKENENATAQPVISGRKVYPIVVGLPPLAEQHRIVAKVDELMALCDQLEQQQTNTNEAHQTLVDTLLGTLTKAESPVAFKEAWQRIANHFDNLLITEHSIDQLKQTILQLAVMGKLVPQNPDDEPASELLKKIGKEKERLVKEGEIKKQASLAEITDDEKPFELPKSWKWVRIGDASLFTEYGLSEMTFDGIKGVPVLKMGDIQDGKVILGGQKLVPNNVPGLPTLLLKKWDLLYNRTNSAELVGKTGIFDGEDDSYTFASYLIRIRCSESCILPQYLNLAMNEPLFRKTQIEPHLKQQCGQANVNGTILKNMCVPIPPYNEQYRIISKVEELFALCDALKERLRDAQALQNQLAVAVVEEAV